MLPSGPHACSSCRRHTSPPLQPHTHVYPHAPSATEPRTHNMHCIPPGAPAFAARATPLNAATAAARAQSNMARAAARLHVWWGARADPCGPGLLASGTLSQVNRLMGVSICATSSRGRGRADCSCVGGCRELLPTPQRYSCRRRRARLSSHAHACKRNLRLIALCTHARRPWAFAASQPELRRRPGAKAVASRVRSSQVTRTKERSALQQTALKWQRA